MKDSPKSVSVTTVFIILNAVFWLAYTVITAFGGTYLTTVSAMVKSIIVILAFGSSTILVGIAIFVRRRNRFAFYFGLLMLTIIAVLSITDEFGWLDFFSLLISLIPLVLLLKARNWYLRPRHN
ncbi:MAG: hypothetical protein H6660_15765 [Ardenticatenaceae bacterium]|nr:hypothetical protein [Ardenticatenaceae bacterium]